jgi:serine/threonine protein kinase
MGSEEGIVGATIAGKYRVRRVVGGGSMGVVCEAEHVEIGKRVAIKLIDASLTGMTDIAMRFRQEARATSLVESQHIVQVFDVGADPQLGLYLVMEYLTGEDLAKVLARERHLPLPTAVRIALQVARGLAKAHEAGVVHRDLKPANIFLCSNDDDQPVVKILDFGISKVVDSSRAGSRPGLKLTRDGMVVGTPQYMSPEQAQGFAVDERTDVWSLGLVLYEMLSGRPAYPELPTYEQFIIHLVSNPPDPIREGAPWIPDDLASVVHAAVEHDLTKRIQSCGELIKRLERTSAAPLRRGPHWMEAGRREGGPPDPGVSETTDTWSDPRSFDELSSPRLRPIEPPLDQSLSSSGVRSMAPDEQPPVEDFEEDAPQFFDRKAFQTLGAPPAAFLPPEVIADMVTLGDPTSASPPRTDSVRRFRLGWAGLALLVLGLGVVAALAWR